MEGVHNRNGHKGSMHDTRYISRRNIVTNTCALRYMSSLYVQRNRIPGIRLVILQENTENRMLARTLEYHAVLESLAMLVCAPIKYTKK